MTTDTQVDYAALLARPAPRVRVDNPYQHLAIVSGTARGYAAAAATAADKRYAAFTALAAGDLIRKAFGATAERALFDRDDDGHMGLIAVYDADGQMLWYYRRELRGSLAVRDRDNVEAYGGPVLPILDYDTRAAIQDLINEAEDAAAPDGWLDEITLVIGKTEDDGEVTEQFYPGYVFELKISEAERDAEWHRTYKGGSGQAAGGPLDGASVGRLLDHLRAHLATYRSTDDAETANDSAEQIANAAEALVNALQIRAYSVSDNTDDRLEQVVVSRYGVDLSIRGRTEDLFVHVDSSDRDEDDAIRYPLVVGVNNASEDTYHS